jgi:predicted dinucleotide-binding enzyme
MKIGFIGAGIVAQTISKHVLPFGHQVLLSNTRGPDSLASLVRELGPGATAGSPQEAAAQDMVVLAVNWSSVQTARLRRSHPLGRRSNCDSEAAPSRSSKVSSFVSAR